MSTRIICLAIGYAFGLFQTAYIIGKAHGIDIREHGSGNSGTTNMMRTMGTKAGLWTFAGDCLKAILAIVCVRVLFGKSHADILPLLSLYAGAGAILGHNFPFYLNFKGGKGIACTGGMVFALDPIMTVLGLLTFFGNLFITHYVSLGSLLVYVGIMIELPILGQMGHFGMDQAHLNEMYIVGACLAAMAFWKHRSNIHRLLTHTEHKTYLKHSEKNT